MQKISIIEHTLLTENVLKRLANRRILTILDFLNEDVDKISCAAKITIPQVLDIRNQIFDKYSAPVLCGLILLERHLNKCLNTGIESINTMLNEGVPIGHITELCGLANSGKTQLCHQLAVNCVKHTENTVLYIDTKGDFSAKRIQFLLHSYKKSYKEMAEIMFKIKVTRIWNMEELIELLQNLKKGTIVLNKLSMIIVDSLPCLMLQHLGEESKIGLALLNQFVNYCRFLCDHLQICVVCVNVQTRWVDQDLVELEDEKKHYSTSFQEPTYVEKQNRCLGKYWQHIPALVLLLDKNPLLDNEVDDNTIRQLSLSVLTSNSKVLKQCNLTLSSTGVR
ncbi:unnamed protein product [Chilo suppressalis]|uniref:RecA family profile 1 domain-containing protein n=1 Tax=Chilo suppressalis TaxID=168631 RepID=A0ABN8BET2_CHISP|nr:unnamed protein product [Chilo suppressalis]